MAPSLVTALIFWLPAVIGFPGLFLLVSCFVCISLLASFSRRLLSKAAVRGQEYEGKRGSRETVVFPSRGRNRAQLLHNGADVLQLDRQARKAQNRSLYCSN